MSDKINLPGELSSLEKEQAGDNLNAVRCFRLLTYTAQSLRNLMDQRLRNDDLTTQQGILLTIVKSMDKPTLGDVSKAMSTTHQNAKQIAAALERKGMLKLIVDKSDKRVRRLLTTAKGLRGWKDRDSADFAAIGEWLAGITPAEQKTLSTLLQKLASTLQ